MAGLASDLTFFPTRWFLPPCGDALHHDCADDRERCVVVVVLALVMRVQSGPISRILCAQQKLRVTIIRLGAPLLARSSFLPAGDEDHACIANDARPLFGIAPGGGYRANCVTAVAVRAYRTVSPLPEPKQISGHRRFTFCCPVPRVAADGR